VVWRASANAKGSPGFWPRRHNRTSAALVTKHVTTTTRFFQGVLYPLLLRALVGEKLKQIARGSWVARGASRDVFRRARYEEIMVNSNLGLCSQ
jgi:hypothetical protein